METTPTNIGAAALDRAEHRCQFCTNRADEVRTIVPSDEGGEGWNLDNLVAACSICARAIDTARAARRQTRLHSGARVRAPRNFAELKRQVRRHVGLGAGHWDLMIPTATRRRKCREEPFAPLLEPEPWRSGAACRGSRLDFFDGRPQAVHAALALCASCPVREECLRSELRWPARDQYGVRGGMTADDRRALIRGERVAVIAAVA